MHCPYLHLSCVGQILLRCIRGFSTAEPCCSASRTNTSHPLPNFKSLVILSTETTVAQLLLKSSSRKIFSAPGTCSFTGNGADVLDKKRKAHLVRVGFADGMQWTSER